MELSYLINIVNDIANRFEHPKRPFEHELRRELVNLSDFEKQVVRNRVNNMPYNVGALNVIKILNKYGITSISDYLSHISDEQEQLQIMTEIFDEEESYDFLEELIESNRFNDLLDLCIKNYVNDLIHHQDIVENNKIIHFSSPEIFTKVILPKMLKNLLTMDFRKCAELTEIIINQKEWNLEFGSFRVLGRVFEHLMSSYSTIITKEVCSFIQNERQICWFFVLMIIGYIRDEDDAYVEMKNLINIYMRAFCDSNSISSLHKSLILARQLFFYGSNKKNMTYQQWLKNNIGDLNYKLKDKSGFSDIISHFIHLIPFENSIELLQIHINVQISAPRKEYSNVLEYKQLLKSREEALQIDDLEFTQL